ncbi:MAG: hypothetical protein Ct9H300mP30_1700 [Methanobacteriota archaeon]|nr:MAG: hypothetical protein Ct9H300mP30_1700 [Euryarchaeota archaeon]
MTSQYRIFKDLWGVRTILVKPRSGRLCETQNSMATPPNRNRHSDLAIGPLKARSPLGGVMPQAVICAYARTPVGKHRGALSGFTATELGTLAVRELLRRANIDPAAA